MDNPGYWVNTRKSDQARVYSGEKGNKFKVHFMGKVASPRASPDQRTGVSIAT